MSSENGDLCGETNSLMANRETMNEKQKVRKIKTHVQPAFTYFPRYYLRYSYILINE